MSAKLKKGDPERDATIACKTSPRTVLVIGDLVWDTHIARMLGASRGYHQAHSDSHLTNRYGGAWYLKEVIGQALAAQSIEATVLAPEKVSHAEIEENIGNTLGVAKGFSVWEWFDGVEKPGRAKVVTNSTGVAITEFKWKKGEPSPGAWRIKEFLGCQKADTLIGNRSCPAIPQIPKRPDLLVIDDLGLGFADNPTCWPSCLGDGITPVLVKATPRFDAPLWKRLLSGNGSAAVTVVLSATALRDAGANLSRGLSWDRTLDDVKAEFSPGGVVWPLRECARVVVSFGHSGAAVFSREPLAPGLPPRFLQFERFVFDPEHLEETWPADLPGTTFGLNSVLTASVAVHSILKEPAPSSHLAISRGLAAARVLHRVGGGHNQGKLILGAADGLIFTINDKLKPEAVFRSAFSRALLDEPVLSPTSALPPLHKQTLLTDALGLTRDFLTVAAQNIVRFGAKDALCSVPRLRVGDYFTVDREEIERINTISNLIQDYRSNAADARPLSLAVFGPPGSGKSFAIKQLSASLFGKDQAVLEFNLSQFEDLDALHEAFHEVRDKSVEGKLPLVFWDEFDSMRDGVSLGWLKEFLAPMQDAKFVANGKSHPFGKCIFIFAGGTCASFGEFNKTDPSAESEKPIASDADPTKARSTDFAQVKGPDFVSRLRGYVNIKGPNPTSDTGDEVHVIRRALLLRSLIERHHKNIVSPTKDEVSLSPTVLDAFLRVGDGHKGTGYLHGARSMEAIVSLIRLRSGRFIGPSELPAAEVLDLHVTRDFMGKATDKSQYHLSPEDIDALAAIKHGEWKQAKEDAGYVYALTRDDKAKPPTHHLLVDYDQLDESAKEANRFPARLAALRMASLGYRICGADHPTGKIVTSPDRTLLEKLAISEHRRWMRQHLTEGWAWTDRESGDCLLRHKDICKFANLTDRESKLDHSIIAGILRYLKENGLVLVAPPPSAPKPRPNRPAKASRAVKQP